MVGLKEGAGEKGRGREASVALFEGRGGPGNRPPVGRPASLAQTNVFLRCERGSSEGQPDECESSNSQPDSLSMSCTVNDRQGKAKVKVEKMKRGCCALFPEFCEAQTARLIDHRKRYNFRTVRSHPSGRRPVHDLPCNVLAAGWPARLVRDLRLVDY